MGTKYLDINGEPIKEGFYRDNRGELIFIDADMFEADVPRGFNSKNQQVTINETNCRGYSPVSLETITQEFKFVIETLRNLPVTI